MAGLLGNRPSRRFKIYQEEREPAIFRFNGSLYIEGTDERGRPIFREIREAIAAEMLRERKPSG